MKYILLILTVAGSLLSANEQINMAPIISYLLSDSNPSEEIKKKFSYEYDKYKQIAFYRHKNNTRTLDENVVKNFINVSITDTKEQNGNHSIFYSLNNVHYGASILYFSEMIFLIDGKTEKISYPNFFRNFNYPGFGYYYINNNFLSYTNLSYFLKSKDAVIVKKIADAKNVSVKMYSSGTNIEYTYTQKDIQAVKDGLKLYDLLIKSYENNSSSDNNDSGTLPLPK